MTIFDSAIKMFSRLLGMIMEVFYKPNSDL